MLPMICRDCGWRYFAVGALILSPAGDCPKCGSANVKYDDGEDNMQKVISLTGRAKQVFRFISLMAYFKGDKTLKDLK